MSQLRWMHGKLEVFVPSAGGVWMPVSQPGVWERLYLTPDELLQLVARLADLAQQGIALAHEANRLLDQADFTEADYSAMEDGMSVPTDDYSCWGGAYGVLLHTLVNQGWMTTATAQAYQGIVASGTVGQEGSN